MIAYIGNDNLVRLTGAQAVVLSTGVPTYLNAGATVTFRIQTPEGVDVPGETWPQVMTYVVGSSGDFLGVLRESVVLDPYTPYRFVGVVDAGADQHGAWNIPLGVRTRLA